MLYDPKWEVDAVGKVFLDAADYIEKHGWCQGKTMDDFGRVCVLGALTRSYQPLLAAEISQRFERDPCFGRGGEFIRWNDDPSRTQAEVVAKLRELAFAQRGE